MESRMDGRVALITGASMGLGKAMALKFAGAGAKVALLARRPDVLAEAKGEVAKSGAKVEAYSCDVSDKAALEATWAKVVADFGQVELGANVPGANGATQPVLIDAGKWAAIDAQGAITPVKATTPQLLQPLLDATSDSGSPSTVPPSTVPPSTLPAPTVPSNPVFPIKPPNNRALKNDNKGEKSDKEHGQSTN